MIVYSVDIIDFWNGWQRPEQVFVLSNDTDNSWGGRPWREWLELWQLAQKIAREHLGWEGDIRGGEGTGEGPYVTVVPNKVDEFWEPSVLIGWKQDNNGRTFIASERFALPWLSDCEWVTECAEL